MDIVVNRNLRSMWDDLVDKSASQTFLDFEGLDGEARRYTYEAFNTLIDRTANLLLDLGVRKGDTVAIHLSNSPEMLMFLFGVAKIGAVGVPLHPRSSMGECSYAIQRTEAKVVVCQPDTADVYGDGGDRVHVRHVVLARSAEPLPGTLCFEVERDARPARLSHHASVLSSDDVAEILFTSGTTARPKGVVITHANMIFAGIFVDWQANLTSCDRVLTTMPASHVNFQMNALMPVVAAGATLVMIERYSASRFWRQAIDHGATVAQSQAMMVRTMLLTEEQPWERNSCVREVLYYLPISDEEKHRFERRYATRILNSYGTTETLVGSITDPPHGDRRWPSIGRPGLGYEARIADDKEREVACRAVGEIQIRGVVGRTLMRGYFDDPEATTAAFTSDDWIHTGDLGYMDEDGWFYFVERRSALIKRAGENIAPAEVEAALEEHPDILEAGVIGVPDPIRDQAVKAFVVLRKGATLTVEQVEDHVRSRLAPFKVPTIVEFVPSLPLTRSDKVARVSLGSSEVSVALGSRHDGKEGMA